MDAVIYEANVNIVGAQGTSLKPAQHFHRPLQRTGLANL